MRSKFPGLNPSCKIEVMNDGNFVVAYHNQQYGNNLSICLFDKLGNLIQNRQTSNLYNLQNFSIQDFKLFKANDVIFLYNQNFASNRGPNTLYQIDSYGFDVNISLKRSINLGYAFNHFATYEQNIFGLSFQNGYGEISVYDLNLIKIESFGQNNVNLPF